MGKVFSFETGKKIGDNEIVKIVEDRISVKPIPKEEIKEMGKKAEEMAEKGIESLEKSLEEIEKKPEK